MSERASSPTASVERTWRRARQRLLDARVPGGWWEGRLSSSALSTATATIALSGRNSGASDTERVRAGCMWLARNQNADGGFGDTPASPSNLSTTALAWTALGQDDAAAAETGGCSAREKAEAWLVTRLGQVDPQHLARGLEEVYAEDRTFAVPILVACAAGRSFGDGERAREAWSSIPRLPFELAALPRELFQWLGLPVVSYALPALIAIGQAIEHNRPTRNPLHRALRRRARGRTLRILERIQPAGGGFLEATPLTSFVVISLVASDHSEHPVAERGLEFLRRSMRADGSWPIDTNLATWLTTLARGALASGPEEDPTALDSWLLAQQQRGVHPYTGAAPGGWAWTDRPGGVPDADDTAGAVLALSTGAEPGEPEKLAAARAGARWLARLQNRDGGIPTFCRGWGKLPFDQSCPDLSAHALRAWHACLARGGAPPDQARRTARASRKAQQFLVDTQRADGAWIPLWFGNQTEAQQQNPVYGTSRVLRACAVPGEAPWHAALERGLAWLLAAQGADGGFGGAGGLAPTVEETALALEALADAAEAGLGEEHCVRAALGSAAEFLARATSEGCEFEAQPIGLYFARLWYSEELYPVIFTVSALGRAREILGRRSESEESVAPASSAEQEAPA